MKINKKIIPQTQWGIKCPYEMKPKYITIHNTANSASAKNEYHFAFVGGNKGSTTGWHWVVDDIEAIQAIPNTRNAWHAGDGGKGKGNRESIGIEICYSTDYKSDKFEKATANAVELTKMLMKEYNIPAENVVRHFDWSGKICPHRFAKRVVDANKHIKYDWTAWNKFKSENFGGEMEKAEVKQVYRVRKSWDDVKSQIGAYGSLENAKKACKKDFKVFDTNGKVVYEYTAETPQNDLTRRIKELESTINTLKEENKTLAEKNGKMLSELKAIKKIMQEYITCVDTWVKENEE